MLLAIARYVKNMKNTKKKVTKASIKQINKAKEIILTCYSEEDLWQLDF